MKGYIRNLDLTGIVGNLLKSFVQIQRPGLLFHIGMIQLELAMKCLNIMDFLTICKKCKNLYLFFYKLILTQLLKGK